MSPALADLVNAKELAGRSASLERSLDLRQLPRVAEAGALKGTNVQARLRFAIFQGRTTVEVEVEGVAVFECQRCLKPCETSLRESEQVMVAAFQAAPAPDLAVLKVTSMVPFTWRSEPDLMAVPLVVVLVWQVSQSEADAACLAWLLAVAVAPPPLA